MSRAEKRARILDPLRIEDGRDFDLAAHDPGARSGLDRAEGDELIADARERLARLQDALYAANADSVLVVLQGMDAAGKDGTIAHVMSGMNPQGVNVVSFKQPGPVELAHGFLWRIHQAAPARGRIVIFNRSHYEDVLIARVHPEILAGQHIKGDPSDETFWERRYRDIAAFERYLSHQGTVVLKFFLHISKDEQKKRLLKRLEDPAKHWKFSESDLKERALWDRYQDVYERAIRATATREAPWFVVPADHKWHARLVVGETLLAALEAIDPHVPEVTPEQEAAVARAKREL